METDRLRKGIRGLLVLTRLQLRNAKSIDKKRELCIIFDKDEVME